MFNNAHVHQTFGITNMNLARQISDLYGYGNDESILGLSPNDALLMRCGQRPQVVRRLNYLRDSVFKGMYDNNPYFVRDNKRCNVAR